MTPAQTRILALATLDPADTAAQEEAARFIARQGRGGWLESATRTLRTLDRCKAAEPTGDASDEEVEAWEEELAQWEEAVEAISEEAASRVIAAAEGFGHADSFSGLSEEAVEAVKILARVGAEFRMGDWQPVERVAASPEASALFIATAGGTGAGNDSTGARPYPGASYGGNSSSGSTEDQHPKWY
jgi:hypothetical protein